MSVSPPEPGRLVFTVEEVAERLGVHPNTVRDMIHEGAFRARQVGRVWKIPLSAFEEYLAGRDNPARVMSIDEVAEALGVHRDTVSKMLNAGAIRAVRAGRTWKIPFSAMEEFLAGRDNSEASRDLRGDSMGGMAYPEPTPATLEVARQELETMGFRRKPRSGSAGKEPDEQA